MMPCVWGLSKAVAELLTFGFYGLDSLLTVTAGAQISPDYQGALQNAGANKLATYKGVYSSGWADFSGIETVEPVGLTTGQSLNRPTTSTYVDGGLFQPAVTNICLQSQNFGTTWVSTGVLAFGSGSTLNATTAPDGTMTADFICEDTTASQHRMVQLVGLNGTAQIFSFFAKTAGRQFIHLRAYTFIDTEVTADYDLVNGTVVASSAGAIAKITPSASGFYRCELYYDNSRNAGKNYQVVLCDTAGNYAYTGDGVSGVYLWQVDIANASGWSTPIPTTTGTVTRNATVATIPTANRLANNNFAIRGFLTPREVAREQWLYTSDGASGLYLNASGNLVWKNDTKTVTSTTTLSADTEYSFGVKQSGTDGATLYINGSSEATDATATSDLAWASSDQYLGSKSGTEGFLNGVMQIETALLANVPSAWVGEEWR